MVVYICPCYSLSLSYLPSPGSPFLPCKCIHQYHFSRFHIYALIYEIQPVHPKGDQSWVFIGRADAEAETPIHWPPDTKSWLIGKDPDAGRDWGQGGEGDDRGWDGWMASPTRWTWVWVNSGSWWWRGRPGVLWFTGSQRVRHDWVTELNWTELNIYF